MTRYCARCKHEEWCHSGADKQWCETYKWIKVVAEHPLPTGWNLKGCCFDLEYGPKCDCTGFTITMKAITAAKTSYTNMRLEDFSSQS